MKKLNLQGRTKEFIEFYKFADEYRQEHGGIFDFHNTRRLKFEEGTCCGLYDSDEKKISSAAKNPLFEQIFVHEFCHFTQDIEQRPAWTECKDKFWDDLENKTIGVASWDSLLSIIAMERDCELLSVKFGKKYDLFNTEAYAQRSNSYFYYYHYLFLTGSWKSTDKLYQSNLPKLMPKRILPLKTFEKIDMNIMKEYKKVFKV